MHPVLERQVSAPRGARTVTTSAAALAVALMIATPIRAAEPAPPEAAITELPITPGDREHWSFRPLERPAVPHVRDASGPRNPIDCFVRAQLEDAGLEPLPEAGRATLIRRLSHDLTGLPPRPEDVDEFVKDPAPDAYEKLVDRLLASDAYGARWAQHWLDLARFAETDGFEHDLVRPNAWRYRDWVIAAFNADMPWDRFLRQQIAGDVLRPDEPAAAVATGFLLCGPDMPDINLQEERRHNFLNDMTSTVASVYLGLQMGCAQCHDHKYDPVSQLDFYRLRAFFEGAEIFGERPVATLADREEHERLVGERNRRVGELESEIEQLEKAVLDRVRSNRSEPSLRLDRNELLNHFSDDEHRRRTALTADLERLKKHTLPELPMGRIVRERSGSREPSHLWIRGDFRRPGPRVEPAFPRIVNEAGTSFAEFMARRPGADEARAALALWLTRPDHPLVPRVLANRLWQHHFVRGLSETPSDFGIVGDPPTHPELLDWLAAELAGISESDAGTSDSGRTRSFKDLHRLIVTSAAYRRASRPGEPAWPAETASISAQRWRGAVAEDPDNRLLWRMQRRRLAGEAIRDALLAVSDTLSQRRGGPGVRPPLPEELVSTLLKNQWPVTPEVEDHSRRSIYLFVRRNLRFPLFEVFDRPDTNASCPRRNRSTIAPQALVLLNSELSLAAARALAGRVLTESGADAARQIERCYQLTLGRAPSSVERELGIRFLHDTAARLQSDGRSRDSLAVPDDIRPGSDPHHAAALTDFCLAVFNLNEFIYVD
jgi:Protein of unknown function (DUF1549)/Protein of unknown function (DUF1553)